MFKLNVLISFKILSYNMIGIRLFTLDFKNGPFILVQGLK